MRIVQRFKPRPVTRYLAYKEPNENSKGTRTKKGLAVNTYVINNVDFCRSLSWEQEGTSTNKKLFNIHPIY